MKDNKMPKAKIKNDIRFVDPVTMEVTCNYNGCKDKFEIIDEPKTFAHIPNKVQKREITYMSQSRQCSECGRKFQLDIDKKATIYNKNRAIAESGNLRTIT